MTAFSPPDFLAPRFVGAPDATFVPAPADGVLPDGFFATTNLPTYVRIDGGWRLPREPRMDAALVLDSAGSCGCARVAGSRRGERVAVGVAEDGSAGYLRACHGVPRRRRAERVQVHDERGVPREADRVRDHGSAAHRRARAGRLPDLGHRAGARPLAGASRHGVVHSSTDSSAALLAGNAVAVHDIEASIFGTTLGISGTGQAAVGGHGLHMRAINQVRAAGSIAAAVRQRHHHDGIMHACVEHGVPFVLTGSIRDDGPLPDVVTDAIAAQDAMKRHTTKATMAILIATALHAIATGNMLPAFVTNAGRVACES